MNMKASNREMKNSCIVICMALLVVAVASEPVFRNALSKRQTSELACEQGWVPINNNKQCWKFQRGTVTWLDARAACLADNADLATIDTEEKRLKARDFTWEIPTKVTRVYIGGKKLGGEGGQWSWLDGTAWSWTSSIWTPGEPNNYRGDENCLEFSAGGFNDVTCESVLNAFVCSKRACPSGWTAYGVGTTQVCIQIKTTRLNWADAEAACQEAGGHLVTIHTQHQLDFINGKAKAEGVTALYWIGLFEQHGVEGKWTWADGSYSGVVGWKTGEPDDKYSRQDCGAGMDFVYDANCDAKATGYVCSLTETHRYT